MTPDLWADVMRWWATLGAAIGIWRLVPRLAGVVRTRALGGTGPVPIPQIRLIIAGAGLLCFLSFSFVAGAVLPFATRLSGFGYYSLTLQQILAVAWTLAGFGCWSTAVAFVRSRRLTGLMAFTWFAAMWFASVATAGT